MPEEENLEKKVDAFLAKEADYPIGSIKALREFFKHLHDLLHYYSDQYGPYLSSKLQKELGRLHFEADRLMIEIENLAFERALMAARARREFLKGVEPKAEKLGEKVEELVAKLKQFREEILKLIEAMEAESIARGKA